MYQILFCKYIVLKNALYNVGPKNILENPAFLIHDLPDVAPVQVEKLSQLFCNFNAPRVPFKNHSRVGCRCAP